MILPSVFILWLLEKLYVTEKRAAVTRKRETAETFQLASETPMVKWPKFLVEFQLNIKVLSFLK